MRMYIPVLSAITLAASISPFVAAQEMSGPPKVLQVTREMVKPGKGGDLHDKSEGKFVAAMANAKWPTHYFAMASLSGKQRVDYLIGYDSFKAWQDDFAAQMKNKSLSAELDRNAQSDGDLLDSLDQSVWTYSEDFSYRPSPTLAPARVIETTTIRIKPGHYKDFQDLVKLVINGHKKAGDSAHWAAYELAYGGGDEVTFFSDDKSMADIDAGFAEDKSFHDAVGLGLQELWRLEEASVAEADSELFMINPAQSYPPDEWVKAAPDFWKTKPVAAPAKPAAKPAQ